MASRRPALIQSGSASCKSGRWVAAIFLELFSTVAVHKTVAARPGGYSNVLLLPSEDGGPVRMFLIAFHFL